MQIDIPRQLERPEFRFVLVQERAKRPVERQWTTTNNYRFDRPKLQDWLAKRGNYGVCCGYGHLVVVDSDDRFIAERSQEKLGATFRVRSGSGRGFHDYITIEGMQKKEIFERNGKHLGEAQFVGQMVVGPGSVHPSGGIYQITNDAPILTVTGERLRAAFQEFIRAEKKTYSFPKPNQMSETRDTLQSLPLTAVLYDFKGVCKGRYVQGKNPWHSAKTGTNFT